MAKKVKWSAARQVKELEGWFSADMIDFRRDDPRRDAADFLERADPDDLVLIGLRLWRIALWHHNVGCLAVLKGDQSGWADLRLGLECNIWSSIIKYGHYHTLLAKSLNCGPPMIDHANAALAMASAIALHEPFFPTWAGERMLQCVMQGTGFFCAWRLAPFYPFLARLYGLWRNKPLDADDELVGHIGVYQGVLDHWEDDKAYVKSLEAACDYHCERINAKKGQYAEFDLDPYRQFPGGDPSHSTRSPGIAGQRAKGFTSDHGHASSRNSRIDRAAQGRINRARNRPSQEGFA